MSDIKINKVLTVCYDCKKSITVDSDYEQRNVKFLCEACKKIRAFDRTKAEIVKYAEGRSTATKTTLFKYISSLITTIEQKDQFNVELCKLILAHETTIESQQKELETETKDRRDCEKAATMWKKHSEDQELLVIKREKIIESQKEEIEALKRRIRFGNIANSEIGWR